VPGGVSNPVVHLLLSLYTDPGHPHRHAELDATLRAAFAEHGLTLVSTHDAHALPDGRVHFGYVDGLSQPFIAGTPDRRRIDLQPDSSAGDFLLGADHVNIYGGNFAERLPPVIADNGTYGVFRIIRQDVVAFEDLLQRTAARHGLDVELVAAKLLGRWRSGTPLVMAPDADRDVPTPRLNDFDYAPAPGHETYFDDDAGVRCPIGSHIRRLNPRGGVVMGVQHNRRIIRRGIAYGPAFDPAQGDDGIERGLVGYFICGDIENQFEFILSTWVNRDFSTYGVRGTRDPILGVQPPTGGKFTIRTDDSRDPIRIDDLPQLTTTRGSLYCFLPGIGALRWLAALPG
jgi:deferrochelatase/peroxidase EfeB